MKIVYSPQARKDLLELREYISNVLKNSVAAKNVTDKILKTVHLLQEQPNIGIRLSEKTGRDTDYLCLFVGKYGAIYRIEDEKINIVRILDLRTDYMRIVFEE
ncbi:MAG: type II toxin-antitoxin system RelE/ParE family toxin [Oscillospiraceae bacterium]|nr:type II toxin-antitoxin system RelE/ParE family toxin [Oscillospiraceae bacterium]